MTKPITVVKMSCKLLQVKRFLIMFNFLALLDIRVLVAYNIATLLIGLILFYSQAVFVKHKIYYQDSW